MLHRIQAPCSQLLHGLQVVSVQHLVRRTQRIYQQRHVHEVFVSLSALGQLLSFRLEADQQVLHR